LSIFRVILGIFVSFALLIAVLIRTGDLHIGEHPLSREEATMQRFNMIVPPLEDFKHDCGRYPTTEEGFRALMHGTKGPPCPEFEWSWAGDKPEIFEDGWKMPLRYSSDGKGYRIEASHGLSKVSR
jgi:hypothetical protein